MKSKDYYNEQLDKVSYNPETGEFKWIVDTKKTKCGDKAGSIGTGGHLKITIDRISYQAQRIAWFKTTGNFPDGNLKFIDKNKMNLRAVNITDGKIRLAEAGKQLIYFIDTRSNEFNVCAKQGAVTYWCGKFKTLDEAKDEVIRRSSVTPQKFILGLYEDKVLNRWDLTCDNNGVFTTTIAKTKREALAVALSVIIQLQSGV